VKTSAPQSEADVLSQVMGMLQLHGKIFRRCEFAAPWGIWFPAEWAHFHVIEKGECWLQPGEESEPLRLGAGDLVVLPRGTGHRLGSDVDVKFATIEKVVARHRDRPQPVMRYGGKGAQTHMLCGVFTSDAVSGRSVLASLPAVLHLPGEAGKTLPWLEFTIRFLLTEVKSSEPGSDLMTSRLIDLILVQAIRYWITHAAQDHTGWIAALRDSQIRSALAKLHTRPEKEWTVPELATEVAMSRSAFAARFRSLVGESPLHYLTRWRMELAARLLRTQRVSQVAGQVGYKSEAAFSRAFKRSIGVAPADFKRDSEQHLSS
jgi:AraC-like DNA-binding protein